MCNQQTHLISLSNESKHNLHELFEAQMQTPQGVNKATLNVSYNL